MSVCTFFGHRNCPDTITSTLKKAIVELIEYHNVNIFYVGNNGSFDSHVLCVLSELSRSYPHIKYAVVLAYMPSNSEGHRDKAINSMLPEGIETVPKRFAISWRNKWMLNQSDYVITYVTRSWGWAAQFAEMAEKQHKQVINLATVFEN